MLESIDPGLIGIEREQEALVAAIGALLDELERVDRALAVQHFRLHNTFRGVSQISPPRSH